MARVGAAPAFGQRDALRPDPPRGMATRAGGGADGDHAIGFGGGGPVGAVRDVKAMRRGLFEDIHPVAQHAPVLPGGADRRLALDHDKDRLAVPRRLRRAFPGAQPVKREPHIAPAGRGGRDVMHLAMGAEGAMQQSAHGSCPFRRCRGDLRPARPWRQASSASSGQATGSGPGRAPPGPARPRSRSSRHSRCPSGCAARARSPPRLRDRPAR